MKKVIAHLKSTAPYGQSRHYVVPKLEKESAEPQFHPELTQLRKVEPGEMPQDELFDQAVRVVLETKRGSVSLLQRRLSIGYARASRIIEMMAGAGILGDYKGSQAREVLMTIEDYEQFCKDLETSKQLSLPGMEEQHEPEPEPEVTAYATEGQQGYLSTCPRCGATATLASCTKGQVQHRKCQACGHRYKVTGRQV